MFLLIFCIKFFPLNGKYSLLKIFRNIIIDYDLNFVDLSVNMSSEESKESKSVADLFKLKLRKFGTKYLPIVYSDNYDISLWKLEALHPFDVHKWKKVDDILEKYFEALILRLIN